MSIAGFAGWLAYDMFLIVSLLGRPIYDPNPLRHNPNPKKPVLVSYRVRELGWTLTSLGCSSTVCTMHYFHFTTHYRCSKSSSSQLWYGFLLMCVLRAHIKPFIFRNIFLEIEKVLTTRNDPNDFSARTEIMPKTSNYMISHAIANLPNIFVNYYIFNFIFIT